MAAYAHPSGLGANATPTPKFVLKYLLGYEDVKNDDGSWTEWGNLVGAPIER
jgi:3-mercaptopyruvate sulfurtransferase SseA